jgi:hypothetical protein
MRDSPARKADDPVVQRQLKTYLIDNLKISNSQIDGVMRLVTRALETTEKDITDTDRNRLRSKAKRLNQRCYMCGGIMNFEKIGTNQYEEFTLDHIWPKCYGGNSVE